MTKIIVKDTSVSVVKISDEDYISLTDMLKAKDGDFFFSNWLRNRNTVEFLGIWERLNNPNFNCAEFDIIKSQAGELICLSNMENLNAVFIDQGMSQHDRLIKLNQIAIQQMRILGDNENRKLLK